MRIVNPLCDVPSPSSTPVTSPINANDDANEISILADSIASFSLGIQEVTTHDVLATNELAEDDPPPTPPSNDASEWFLVSNGRQVGCFLTWEQAGPLVNRHSCNVHRKYTTFDEMWAVWVNNCLSGLVRGPLHRESVVPMVIPRHEINRRITEETTRRMTTVEASMPAATNSSSTTPAVVAVSTDLDVGLSASAVTRSNESVAICNPIQSSSNMASAVSSSILSSMRSPSLDDDILDMKGKIPVERSLVDDERHGRVHVYSSNVPPPLAWVVIRGIAPGVYNDREEYIANRGGHSRVWVIPCPTEERAEGIFSHLIDFMEFLPPQ